MYNDFQGQGHIVHIVGINSTMKACSLLIKFKIVNSVSGLMA